MTRDEIFEIWAPPGGRWSPWVKPVLFACVERAPQVLSISREWDGGWVPKPSENVAIVVDLAGADGVDAGLALASQGYRPVPLYNAVWLPAPSLVEIEPIVAALWQGTDLLRHVRLDLNAPPAFLLDANRRGEGALATPGRFDNRSVSFTTDFPSATFLAAHQIDRAVLVQSGSDQPQPDLAHTLRRWQEGGIRIELKRLDQTGVPSACEIPKPSRFGAIWYRALVVLGLRRHKLGGFGGFIPEPSAG